MRLAILVFGGLVGLLMTEPVESAERTPAPLPAEQAVKSMIVPQGFKVSLVAAEPDVLQPVSFCFDDRGRIVVLEVFNYGEWQEKGKDRIAILEDKDGDGRFETRTVFFEGFNYATGIEYGFGGYWVMSVPNLYFIPDKNGDDVPDGPPEVLFDGFGYKESRHNLANGFTWGPDGWLYFGHGRTSPSDVGRARKTKAANAFEAGVASDEPVERIHCDGGVCRIHPTKLVFENFADGTTNPWGVDFDDYGQCFVSNCVNPHLFHVIQGAHYEPWRNRPSSLYAYERIATIADHLHYPVNQPKAMRGETPETLAMGGGHAHCGTLVYLGGAFPERYRNSVFMCNVHGRRINNDILKRSGSGYVASHGPDFMISGDPWFMGVTLRTGPDGAIYVSDWSDTGECHTYKPDRASGRIYRIGYVGNGSGTTATNGANANGGDGTKVGSDDRQTSKLIRPSGPTSPSPITPIDPKTAAAAKLPLSDRTNAELVQLQLHPNDWFVRHARRLLQERCQGNSIDDLIVRRNLLPQLEAMQSPDSGLPIERRLRAFWTLRVTRSMDREFVTRQLRDPHEQIRAWAVRWLMEDSLGHFPWGGEGGIKIDPALRSTLRDSTLRSHCLDRSPVVRMAFASMLPQLAISDNQRWALAAELVANEDDTTDPNLPLMYWYGVEPLVQHDPKRFMTLVSTASIPKIREFGARRFVEHVLTQKGVPRYEPLMWALSGANDEAALNMLTGAREAWRGLKQIDKPSNWSAAYGRLQRSKNPEIRQLAVALAVSFGDKAAIADLMKTALNRIRTAKERNAAIDLLRDQNSPQIAETLQSLLDDKDVRRAAIRGLAVAFDKDTPSKLVVRYSTFSTEEKQDAVATLTSRKEYAAALLDAVDDKKIPRGDVSAYAARQMHAFGDKSLTERLRTVWGEIRDSAPEKQQLIAKLKSQLSPNILKNADLANGKLLFKKTCQQCHRLFGEGGAIGPDLTGSNRGNMDYLLGNIIDPSAEIGRDYRMSIVTTKAGRIVTGLQVESSPTRLTLQTATEKIVLDRADIEEVTESPLSIMPEGQLNALSKEEIRDLIGFLMTP